MVNVGGGFVGNPLFEKLETALMEMKCDPKVVSFIEALTPQYTADINFVDFEDDLVTLDTLDTGILAIEDSSELLRDEEFLNPLIDDRVQFIYEAVILLVCIVSKGSRKVISFPSHSPICELTYQNL